MSQVDDVVQAAFKGHDDRAEEWQEPSRSNHTQSATGPAGSGESQRSEGEYR